MNGLVDPWGRRTVAETNHWKQSTALDDSVVVSGWKWEHVSVVRVRITVFMFKGTSLWMRQWRTQRCRVLCLSQTMLWADCRHVWALFHGHDAPGVHTWSCTLQRCVFLFHTLVLRLSREVSTFSVRSHSVYLIKSTFKILLVLILLTFVCTSVLPASVLCITWMPGTHKLMKISSDALGLELHTAVILSIGCWELNKVLWKNSQCFIPWYQLRYIFKIYVFLRI